MNEKLVIIRALLIANYAGIVVSFILFLWLEFRPNIVSLKNKLWAGYAAGYFTSVFIVLAIDRYITYRVYTFDKDGDRVFQDHELVGDLGFLWNAMILDTGRNVFPITQVLHGAVGAGLAYGLAFACSHAVKYCRAKLS